MSIITGGASGIGGSTVQPFHESGAKVVIADVQDNLGIALAQKLGENVCYIHCNVSNENEVYNLVDTTIKRYGKLDITYNNAGIIDRPSGSILDTRKSDLDRVIGVNLMVASLEPNMQLGLWYLRVKVAYHSLLVLVQPLVALQLMQ